MTTELKRLHDAATAGPWFSDPNPMRDDGKFLCAGELKPANKGFLDREFAEKSRRRTVSISCGQLKPDDADLVAHLRNHAPAFIALIEAADAVDTDWNADTAKALREALKPFAGE